MNLDCNQISIPSSIYILKQETPIGWRCSLLTLLPITRNFRTKLLLGINLSTDASEAPLLNHNFTLIQLCGLVCQGFEIDASQSNDLGEKFSARVWRFNVSRIIRTGSRLCDSTFHGPHWRSLHYPHGEWITCVWMTLKTWHPIASRPSLWYKIISYVREPQKALFSWTTSKPFKVGYLWMILKKERASTSWNFPTSTKFGMDASRFPFTRLQNTWTMNLQDYPESILIIRNMDLTNAISQAQLKERHMVSSLSFQP